ncbi:MAG TPA: hypothetical protein VG839_09475 [Asticcacaulis sp.]|nr:hypothetical protein [Asticcacaulis sp.]
MSKLKSIRDISNIIYAVANWDEDPNAMREKFRKAIEPKYYPQVYRALVDLITAMAKGRTYEWALAQAKLLTEEMVQNATVSALKVLKPHFENRTIDWFLNDLPKHEFQASADVKIPVKIFGVIKDQNGLHLVVLCHWKKALSTKQLRILASLVKYYAEQYPELAEANLEMVDLSCVGKHRTLKVHTWNTLELLSSNELNEVMKGMADAYLWAVSDFEANPTSPRKKPKKPKDRKTGDLFPEP